MKVADRNKIYIMFYVHINLCMMTVFQAQVRVGLHVTLHILMDRYELNLISSTRHLLLETPNAQFNRISSAKF
jgi:hypothetical protein